LALEFLREDIHDFAIAQLFIFGLHLAFFAEDERVGAVGVAMLVEALGTDGMTADQS